MYTKFQVSNPRDMRDLHGPYYMIKRPDGTQMPGVFDTVSADAVLKEINHLPRDILHLLTRIQDEGDAHSNHLATLIKEKIFGD